MDSPEGITSNMFKAFLIGILKRRTTQFLIALVIELLQRLADRKDAPIEDRDVRDIANQLHNGNGPDMTK